MNWVHSFFKTRGKCLPNFFISWLILLGTLLFRGNVFGRKAFYLLHISAKKHFKNSILIMITAYNSHKYLFDRKFCYLNILPLETPFRNFCSVIRIAETYFPLWRSCAIFKAKVFLIIREGRIVMPSIEHTKRINVS